jgi:hypothetical protein
MSLIIETIRNPGDLNRERVVMRVVEETTEIGEYIVLSVRADGKSVFGGDIFRGFWLPDAELNAGDTVVLYTKSGNRGRKTNKNGSKSLFFYWGLTNCRWKPDTNAAVLFNVTEWQRAFPLEDDASVEGE